MKIIKVKRRNIDKINYLLFVDTETIGSIYYPEGVLPFEIGVKIYDNVNKKVVYARSFIVKRLFNNKYAMLSSFSASKYPTYKENIKNTNMYFVGSVKDIYTKINNLIKRYGISIMVAHNGNFDKQALDRLGCEFGILSPFNNLDLLDTMEISTIITNSKSYVKFCEENKQILNDLKKSAFTTNSGRVRLTAQAIYCYIINDPTYKESHTALQDIDDEISIYEKSVDLLGNRLVKLNTSPKWQDYDN